VFRLKTVRLLGGKLPREKFRKDRPGRELKESGKQEVRKLKQFPDHNIGFSPLRLRASAGEHSLSLS
jgi:hypothetical protein